LAAEAVVGLVRLAQSALEDPRVMLVPPDLPGLRAMLGNVDLPDQKALGDFKAPLDLLVAELEGPLFPAPRVTRAPPDLLDLRVRMARPVLLDLLVPRVLPDLLESVALPVRMR